MHPLSTVSLYLAWFSGPFPKTFRVGSWMICKAGPERHAQSVLVLRIRDVDSWYQFRIYPSRISGKKFKYFCPKILLPSSGKYDPVCSSRIRIFSIPDLGSGFRSKRHGIPNPQHCVCTWKFSARSYEDHLSMYHMQDPKHSFRHMLKVVGHLLPLFK